MTDLHGYRIESKFFDERPVDQTTAGTALEGIASFERRDALEMYPTSL